MAGLLGDSFDDPRTGAVLQAAMGLLGGGSNAQRFAGAGATYAQMMQAERAKRLREEEIRQQMAAREQLMQQQRAQMAEREEERKRAMQDEGIARRLFGQPQQMGMPGAEMGPAMPEPTGGMINPQTFLAQGGSLGGLGGVQGLNQLLMAPERKPLISKPGDIARDPVTGKELWSNPSEPEKAPEALRALAMVYGEGSPEYIAAARAYARKMTTQPGPAAVVNVGGGQKDANWGAPPKDRVWARDAAGNVMTEQDPKTGAFRPIAVPIGGSDAATDAAKLEAKAAGSVKQAGAVLETVEEASKLVSGWNTGVLGTLSGVPTTEAKKLSGLLTTIKANLGFDRLQQMRDQSPTGGALGQVAIQELASLQATVAALDQLQKPEDLRAALAKIAKHYRAWEATLGGGQQAAPAGGGVLRFDKNGDPVN